MNVFVNEEVIELQTDASLTFLLEQLNTPTKGIAVAVNQQVIQRTEWDQFKMTENDQVLIIRATQGG
ncbi:sulfur carrier protein ThiS [Puteibacter caeruleilacunae]|nr:sulfur carrier protein ThiS [Puteibacter caeruleilacunae]